MINLVIGIRYLTKQKVVKSVKYGDALLPNAPITQPEVNYIRREVSHFSAANLCAGAILIGIPGGKKK